MEIAKILLVDDDALIRRVGELCLSRIGNWNVVLASSGAEALQMIPQEKPDLILLDVMMPGMDGPTVLSNLRKEEASQNTPVIFMTAKVRPEEVETYLAMDAAGVITKPFDPIQLTDEIKGILSLVCS